MKIGGLQPVTLLDYPQKVAATVFTSGCNMRCAFCYNPNLVVPDLVSAGGGMPEEQVKEFFVKRKSFLDGVCITGGEPLMQPDLKEFCGWLKDLGYAIKLDTNGLLPEQLQGLIDNELLDYIAMDVKGPLDNYSKFAGMDVDSEKIKRSIDVIQGGGVDYEFRSTIVKDLHTVEDIVTMAGAVVGAKRYFLQNFLPQDKLVGEDFDGKGFTQVELKEVLARVREVMPVADIR
jgi:pyruvate formate lyase activating enzyme